ncbi:histidine phosphatase family protein, partial [Microbacteriaceae bacterium K1510]|nr:histidine phosphatase family protein [Microbacteriaceae bacterium K1510]
LMRWIWIRHGETAENNVGQYLGHYDVPLHQRGIVQATELAQALADEPISLVFSSDLIRAVETARIIGQRHGLEPAPVSALRELSFGRWERKTYDELMSTERELVERWYE